VNSSTSIQPEDRRRRGLLDHASGMWSAANRYAVVLTLLIGLFIFFSVSQDNFFTQQNVENLLTSVSILWVVSIGMTFVVLTAGIDLSVGSLLALTGIILSKLFNDVGLPAPLAVLAAIGIAALIGAGVNGVLIGRVGLSFFVVTLGTLSLYQGIVSLWSHTQTTYVTSTFIGSIGFGEWLGIPTPIWIMLGTYIAAFVVLRWTYFGRDVYAVGGNIEAARLSGINVARTLIIVYGIAGLCAGIAGCIQVGRLGAASPMVGADIPLNAAAAVLLGGTSFLGGVGGVSGTAVGVLFIGTLQNGLAIAGVQSFWQQVVTGVILIVAIAIDRVQQQGASLWSRKGPPAAPATPGGQVVADE
jgi:ribose transport system permease protein